MLEHLPPGNPAQREIFGPWGDDQMMLHDISSQLRNLVIQNYNRYRDKGQPAQEPEYLPNPRDIQEKPKPVAPEVIQAERDFLQSVLNRPNPH